jgi:hypothetical protein
MCSACGFYMTNPGSTFNLVTESSHPSICYTPSEPTVHCQLSHTSIWSQLYGGKTSIVELISGTRLRTETSSKSGTSTVS